jgi:YesN/AraC family two-component response regulator
MPYILEREMELLLCYLCFIPEELTEHSTVRIYSNEVKRIVLNYIQTAYKNASLVDLSVLVGFTPTYLSRWISKNMNTTFKDLLLEQRFSVASDLLLRTKMSISDILNSVGYENSSYFHKQFIARFGMTPRAYRKQKQ